jgi:protein-serine/threonine kinase
VAESTTSLLRKYGVCDNGAIGKGATSVVRLVHKWDRTEEKIYAVKVSELCLVDWNSPLIVL